MTDQDPGPVPGGAGAPAGTAPRVLLLYYSYTGQTRKVLDAAGAEFLRRGAQVDHAVIEFTDPRYAERFSQFPMRSVWPDFLGMLPAQTRRLTGDIRTPDEVRTGGYDLVLIGSPTWWRTVSMPLRTFLTSYEARPLLDGTPVAVVVVCRRYWRENLAAVRKLVKRKGGRFVGSIHFTYPGGQVASMLSLTSYLGSGEYRDRYLGVKLPPTNISADQEEEARRFAAGLATKVLAAAPVAGR